jgi:flagellar protein FliO/FliZ
MLAHVLATLAASAIPLLTHAVDAVRPAFTPPPAATVSSGSVLQVILSLLLVLTAVAVVAWVLKRINLPPQNSANALKIISSIAVGQRERVVLMEINDTWLIVGVAPGQVNALHTMPKEALPSTSKNESGDNNKFHAWLKQVMEKRDVH